MDFYPYNAPIIMTDAIFLAYGGLTGSSTQAQRTASYLMAEETVTSDISTFLLPTTVTGTFHYPFTNQLLLDYGYVNQIYNTKFLDFDGNQLLSVDGIHNSYLALRDQIYGLVDIGYYISCCGYPYEIQMAYNAGFPSGTSYHSNILLALTTYSQIVLNEIIGFGNETSGDAGVTEFRSQQYYEYRKMLLRTTFGSSAKANFIHKLLAKYRRYRKVGL